MRNVFLAVLTALILLTGCGVTKEVQVDDKTTQTTETEKKETIRKGDTVEVFRPFNVKYRDTTITTYSYETKSIVRETYDNEGNQTIECITDEIRELLETTKQVVQNDIETRKKLDAQFDPASLIWAIAGLGGVVLLLAIVGFVIISRMQKAMPTMVAQAVKAAIAK